MKRLVLVVVAVVLLASIGWAGTATIDPPNYIEKEKIIIMGNDYTNIIDQLEQKIKDLERRIYELEWESVKSNFGFGHGELIVAPGRVNSYLGR
jgi:hypothetical protein